MTAQGEPRTRCLPAPSAGASRFVGDPVDIVSGALIDQDIDFRLPRAALPLSWVRRYDSRQSTRDRGVGLGFRHELDHELRFDVDGLTYTSAAWESTSFPFLAHDGERVVRAPLSLERVSTRSFRVHTPNGRVYEFTFDSPTQPARLERVSERERVNSLYYERITGRYQLSAVGLGMLGRLSVEWAQGRIVRFVLKETDPERATELAAYRYDEHGHLIEARNAYKHSLRYAFDAQRRMAQKIDRRGYAFHFQWDAAGRCIDSRGEDGAEAVQLEYRPLERATIVTRHDGGKWQYQYNDAGTITNILDPLGGMHAYVLDDQGRVSEEIDPLGNTTTVRYDARAIPIAKRDPFGHWLPANEDDDTPHPLDHRVAATPLEFELGLLVAPPVRLPAADTPLWEVPPDARAALQTADPALGGRTRLEHNLQGLPLRELREGAKTRRWAFDENANVRWQIDFDGRKRDFEYTSDNHLALERDASGRVTRYEHSATEKLTAFTDPGGTRSEYVRDLKDRVCEVRRHGKVRERYVYDSADNLIEKRDGNGELLLERTIGAGNVPVGCKVGGSELHTFEYDDKGRLVEANGGAGKCTFGYSPAGERRSDLRDGRGVVHAQKTSGARTTTVLERFVTHYSRTRNGALSITDPTGRTHRIKQLAPGVVQRELSSGAREVTQYDTQGRCLVKCLYRERSGAAPWIRGFHYSGEGDLLERRDSARGTTSYTCDLTHRLQQVVHPDRRVDSYEYDAADNLLSLPSDGPERVTTLRLQSGNRLDHAGGQTFHYDDRDHIARRERSYGTVHYVRDALDQLTEIKAPELHWSAHYDALGRRSDKAVNGRNTQYYWDGDRLIAEISSGGAVRVYIYADALALVPLMFVTYASLDDEPQSGRCFYVFSDHLGSVELILNDKSETVWQARLDPYGIARIEEGQHFAQPLRFPGHFYDAETGLHYNRYRYYDPALGRYLESDPIGLEGGVNLYAYTRNPLKEVDVDGLARKCPDALSCKLRKKIRDMLRPNKEGDPLVGEQLHPTPDLSGRADEAMLRQHYDALDAHEGKYQRRVDACDAFGASGQERGGHDAGVTEAIGERALTAHMINNEPDAVMVKGFEQGSGFDQVWVKKDGDGNVTEYIVGEAKGPGQDLSTDAKKGPQMSDSWVHQSADDMSQSKDPQTAALGSDMKKALTDGPPPQVTGRVVESGGQGGSSLVPVDGTTQPAYN